MGIINIKEDDFFKEVTCHDGFVILEMWADWCGPCRLQEPILKEVSEKYNVKVCRVDVDLNVEINDKFNIRSIPTLLIFNKGELIKRAVGLKNEEYFKEFLLTDEKHKDESIGKIFALSYDPSDARYGVKTFTMRETIIEKTTKERIYFKDGNGIYRNYINKAEILIPMNKWTSKRNTVGSTIFCFEKDIEKAKNLIIQYSEEKLNKLIEELQKEMENYEEFKKDIEAIKKEK